MIEPAVASTLKKVISDRTSVYFSGSGCDATFETRILRMNDKNLTLANRVPPELIADVVKSDGFSLQCHTLQFKSDFIETDGVSIFFPFKGISSLEKTRLSERFPFTQEEKVVCQFVNPFDRETIINKRVIDMSATGLSLRTPADTKLFPPGLVIPELRVLIDGKPYAKASAKVIYRRKLVDYLGSLRLQVGLQFLNPQDI